MSIALAIHGAAGRMGTRVFALAATDPDFNIAAAIEAPGHPHIGRDAGECAGIGQTGMVISDFIAGIFDVMIDFSSADATRRALEICVDAARPLVIGTTGHSPEHVARIDEAARRIAIVYAANMSVGVNVMVRVVQELAAALDEEYDCEIVETHHRFKADAPSGTALALLGAVQAGRARARPGQSVGEARQVDVVHGREGATGQRPRGQIGMHAVRLGDTVGEHVVSFGALGETLSVRHEAHTRDTFAAGALRAAKWVASRPAGKYTMQDVLFGRS